MMSVNGTTITMTRGDTFRALIGIEDGVCSIDRLLLYLQKRVSATFRNQLTII